ncbi:golgin candidate 1-like [Dorcoceras hygrometricum]|uniref:Golgin candidate 1-like n=1 Tax=Dorcoceras hygrometricum TaxID=472368 RepID=A0A2Z7A0R5_9LAMI|nr:golgin candidate 1-like [Dorcoceras hygrometricum]
MASWLKAAEDLFEVVDRRAKLVVGEQSDELPVTTSGSNVRGSQGQRTRSKPQKKRSSKEAPESVSNLQVQGAPETSGSHAESDGNIFVPSVQNHESDSVISVGKVDSSERKTVDTESPIMDNSISGVISNEATKSVDGHSIAENSSNVESVASNSNENLRMDGSADILVGNPSSSAKFVETGNDKVPVDSITNITQENEGSSGQIEFSESQTLNQNTPSKSNSQTNDVGLVTETGNQGNSNQEQESITSHVKAQEQLEEVCAGLSSRLQEYKSENAQLEELLMAERELSKSYEARINQLQRDLSASKSEVSRAESNMVEALAAKNAEIEALVSSVDALKKQAALSEGNSASLQANMESMIRNRELTETRMMQALREELAAAERRVEDEHAAHNAFKQAAREREVELEQKAIEASTALARIQRTADDRAAKAAEFEQKVALLEVECASLNQELQDMEARVRRGLKSVASQAEVQKMRVEMAAMKRDAEHYSRQEHMELEKRYRELTDLLYYKQTQLETMASEKAAAEFQLEKEIKRLQEVQLEAERNRASRRASSSWEEDTDMKALEPLPLHHRHMAMASLQLQKAAKLLDSGAVRATRFLWRYPTARIILLFYLVFVHLFLMYLLHRLQEQADSFTSKEFAQSMGLSNQTLP